ncbi:MAG: VIT1/CCC1 transporter family protein [Nitrospirae bacterium]|nr:VIT1/CCC1 transporter family protein [Nitrospirota bacterium]
MGRDDAVLGRTLVLDELFDLTLYSELHKIHSGRLKKILGDLIPVEQGHLATWQKFFRQEVNSLNLGRRIKLRILLAACRLFGPTAVHLVLEAIEIYGIRKYLSLWETSKDEPLGETVKEILRDEFEHEDAIVTQYSERVIDPDRVRSVFLGLNDGLVEIAGAVSGFYAALRQPALVLMASASVAVAGALSMAAGAYAASSSEKEMLDIEAGKAMFLSGSARPTAVVPRRPVRAAATVGLSYLLGAVVPVLPVLFGAEGVFASLLAAAGVVALVSLVLAFLSGMQIRKRVAMNLVLVAGAVGATYLIGLAAQRIWGISI